MRSGVIAKKIGMTRIFSEDGKQIPVTVLHLDRVEVVANRTKNKDGYSAVELGSGSAKVKNVTKAMRGHFSVSKVEPKSKLVEFRVSEENMIDVGVQLTVDHYLKGQFVDIAGATSCNIDTMDTKQRAKFAGGILTVLNNKILDFFKNF